MMGSTVARPAMRSCTSCSSVTSASGSSLGLSGFGSPRCTVTSTARGTDSSTDTTPRSRCFSSSKSLPCRISEGRSSPSEASGGTMNPMSSSYRTTLLAISMASEDRRPRCGLSRSPNEKVPARVMRVVRLASLATAPNLPQAGPNLFFAKPRQKMSRTSASFSSGASFDFLSSSLRLYCSSSPGEASSSGGARKGTGSRPLRCRVAAHLLGTVRAISMTVS
mmetsp:Transcript_20526/g.45290  ORF Transcript_20526/g.45290 Transcript_20526/m.45290 type:complete len:222 (-) Transcript_20526:957-1622(-)